MKGVPLGIRLEAAERVALERAALAEQRPLSALGRKIIREWLLNNGWSEDLPADRRRSLPISSGGVARQP